MRAVTTATAAVVLGIERKSLDNILTRIASDAVPTGRQGVERRIPIGLLEELAIATELNRATGTPIKEAFALARTLTGRDAQPHHLAPDDHAFVGSAPLGSYLQLGADLRKLREDLTERVEEAIEAVVRKPRGRRRIRPGQ